MNSTTAPHPSDRFKITRVTDFSGSVECSPGREVLSNVHTLRPELVSEDALVTEKILDPDGAWREGQDLVSKIKAELKTVFCKSLLEWGAELRRRQELGPTLFPCDDPKTRSIGFVDDTENILFNLGLNRIREAPIEDWAAVGIVRNAKSTEPGLSSGRQRQQLISLSLDGWDFRYDAAYFSDEEKVQFRARIDELCKFIEGEQEAERALDDLSATIPRPQP